MFLRPFRVKACSSIKSSERKKWRGRLETAFHWTSDELDQLIPTKSEILLAKLQTYSGEIVTVFCAQKNPYFFEVEGELFPTVYTLWKHPDLLLTFTTWSAVFPKLSGGADLMLPGVVLPPSAAAQMSPRTYGNFEKGTPCTVNVTDNKAPVAVGRTAHSSFDMYMAARRGKCVIIMHCYMDQLWEYGDKTLITQLGPPFPLTHDETEPEDQIEELETLSIEAVDHETLQTEDTTPQSDSRTTQSEDTTPQLEATTANSDDSADESVPQRFSTMDDIVLHTFLKSLKVSGKGIVLPILTSTFYKTLMLPNCPPGLQLDIKKTSYKKLSKFLQSMQDDNLVQIKELTKGVESIVSINLGHDKLRSFVVEDEAVERPELELDGSYTPPHIEDVYFVTADVLPLFLLYKHGKGSFLTVNEVRDIIKQYVSSKCLKSQNDSSLIQLDDVLAKALTKGDSSVMRRWDEVLDLCLSRMKSGSRVTFSSQEPRILKEKLKPIEITTAKRAANKTVTLVNNLETFGIDPRQLAHTIQIRVATSTTVTPNPNKKEGIQVLIQGNQVHHLSKLLLDEYKIPKRYVKGLELAKKKK